jgi:soluble lytic murein transglycosylase-like protein
MQLMPRTARMFIRLPWKGRGLVDPEANISAGVGYLAELFTAAWRRYKLKGVRFHDAPPWLLQRIIAAYNAGPKFLFRRHFYKQTRDYVRKVMRFHQSKVADIRRPVEEAPAPAPVSLVAQAGSFY